MKFDACPFCHDPLFFGHVGNDEYNTSAVLQCPLPRSILTYCINAKCNQCDMDADYGWYIFDSIPRNTEPKITAYGISAIWNNRAVNFTSRSLDSFGPYSCMSEFAPTNPILFSINKYFPFPEKDTKQYFEALIKRLENLTVFI